MLLSNDEFDLESLDFTEMYISEKRDGVRAEVSNKGILGRSLKVLPNVNVQEWFKEVYQNLPNGIIIEAEIHSDSLPCRTIAGICNSKDKEVPEDLKLYVFGIFDTEMTFTERINKLFWTTKNMLGKRYQIVEQKKVETARIASRIYQSFIRRGFEGAVLMDGRKLYKQGRVTIREGIGYKLKPQREDDLEIIDVTERMSNTNESQINELGNSYKRNTVLNKESTGIAAAFVCKLPNGEECKVSLTGEESFRREIWINKESYIGRFAAVKSMDYGTKDKLRHPVLISIKEKVKNDSYDTEQHSYNIASKSNYNAPKKS